MRASSLSSRSAWSRNRPGDAHAAGKGLPRQDRQGRQDRLLRPLQVEDVLHRLEPPRPAAVDTETAVAAVAAVDADAEAPQNGHGPGGPGGHAVDAAGALGDGGHPQGLDGPVPLAGHADLALQARRPGDGPHHQGLRAR